MSSNKLPDENDNSDDKTENTAAAEHELSKTEFSDSSFWDKVKEQASTAGKEVIETALKLYYALQDPDTPSSAKAIIIGALVYFIVPTDAVLDFIPGGYVDDLGALMGALWTVAEHVKDTHTEKAKAKIREWFDD